jgi:cyclohexanone monooxygenase
VGVQTDIDPEADIDVVALQKKYEEERLKRIRPEGIGQYRKLSVFADFDTDPHADPDFTRAPVVEEIDVLLIGGGFGGLLAAGHLRQAGVESLRIVRTSRDDEIAARFVVSCTGLMSSSPTR